MHTLMVVTGGFILLGLCLLVGRLTGTATATAAVWFLPLWLVAAAINMWVGVNHAGYTYAQEFPIFLLVFAVPAVVALAIWYSSRA
ncbi:hypothetical protein ACO2I3_05845 [Leptospira interrogans]